MNCNCNKKYKETCSKCEDIEFKGCYNSVDTKCTIYTNSKLSPLNIKNGDTLETIIKKINTYLTTIGTSENLLSPTTFENNKIPLNNTLGSYNVKVPNTFNTYTIVDNAILGGWAKILIKTQVKPIVVGASEVYGDTFESNKNMYLNIRNYGTYSEYNFEKIITTNLEIGQ